MKSRIKIESALHNYEVQCGGCDKELYNKEEKLHLIFASRGVVLCPDCVRDLREQIDAFRLLVLTGRDTK